MRIVITGPDKSGKSTLAQHVISALQKRGHAARLIQFGDLLLGNQDIDHAKIAALKEQFSASSLDTRSKFLLQAWQRILPQSNDEIQIIEGYWFKYVVQERSYGLDPQNLDHFELKLPTPNLVYYLDADAPTIWMRQHATPVPDLKKSAFFRLEELTEWESFLDYHHRSEKVWQELRHQHPEWMEIANDLSPQEKTEIVLRDLQNLLLAERSAA